MANPSESISPTPQEQVLIAQSKALMDSLVQRKLETGVDFCTEIGQGDRRVVILRQPVLDEKCILIEITKGGIKDWKACRVARYIVITSQGMFSAEFIRKTYNEETLEYETDISDQITGEGGKTIREHEFLFNKYLKMIEKLPPSDILYDTYGFFSLSSGEKILGLGQRKFNVTLNSDVTSEEFSQALIGAESVSQSIIERRTNLINQALEKLSTVKT